MRIQRDGSGWSDRARSYKVFIDGREVGRLKRGEAASFDLGPGDHVLYLKIDWKRSSRFTISGDSDEVIAFECGPNRSSAIALVDLFKSADNTWLYLEPDGLSSLTQTKGYPPGSMHRPWLIGFGALGVLAGLLLLRATSTGWVLLVTGAINVLVGAFAPTRQ